MTSPDSSPRDADARRSESPAPPAGNRLLAALPADDRAWLAPHLERQEYPLYHVIAERGERLTHVYFPESAIVSMVTRMRDGSAVEVGTIGNEGMAGVAVILDSGPTESEMLIQIPGPALRAPAAVIEEAVETRPAFRKLASRYTQAYLSMVAQTAACNRLHHIEERCARWLLMTHDRVGGANAFPLTQDTLAVMLGVRRAGVTVAAGALQDAGLIRYRRGGIRILDRTGLEASACECYGVVRGLFDRLLPLSHG